VEKEVRMKGRRGRGWLYKGHTTCNLMVSELVSRVMLYIYIYIYADGSFLC
jgi:hypothetical protein